MKVITNNYKPQYLKQLICDNYKCKSVLEYEETDIKSRKVKRMTLRGEEYTDIVTSIVCPCCNREIEIKP